MKSKNIQVTHDNITILLTAEHFSGEINGLSEVMPIAGMEGRAYLASKDKMQTTTILSLHALKKTNYQGYLEFIVDGARYAIPADKWAATTSNNGAISISELVQEVFS